MRMFPLFWFSNTIVCNLSFSAPDPQPLRASLWHLCVESANIVMFRDWWIYGVWLSWKQSQIGERQLECDHHRELVPVVWCQLFPPGRLVWRSIEIGDLAPSLHTSSLLSPVNKKCHILGTYKVADRLKFLQWFFRTHTKKQLIVVCHTLTC
jgi:hypothetical protein